MSLFRLPGGTVPGLRRHPIAPVAVLALVSLLAACGGGQDDPAAPAAGTSQPAITTSASGSPAAGTTAAPGNPAAQPGGAGPLDPAPGDDGSGASAETGGATATVLAALNAARAAPRDCGATRYAAALPLATDAAAEEAAAAHTVWMQGNRTMSHTGAGGSDVGTRLTATGYRWSAVGENVAMGQASPAAVVAAWMASPGHCANIMNAAFVDVGFGFAPFTAAAASYATLVLARPR